MGMFRSVLNFDFLHHMFVQNSTEGNLDSRALAMRFMDLFSKFNRIKITSTLKKHI